MSEPLGIDVEALLRRALAPVEPPERLSERLESTLTSLSETAIEELEAWELSAMRDPRNWMRPVVAGAVAGGAGAGLLVLRTRARAKRRAQQADDPLDFAERALRDLAAEARRLVDR